MTAQLDLALTARELADLTRLRADEAARRQASRRRKAADLRRRRQRDLAARRVVADAKGLLLEMPAEPLHLVALRRAVLCDPAWSTRAPEDATVREVAEILLAEIGPDPDAAQHRADLRAAVTS